MLPPIKRVTLPENNFPTLWQTVIFRNYARVSTDKIARVLSCDESVVLSEAKRLGLGGEIYDENWEKLGYISIIRDNWFLLPYEQLLILLDFTEQKLEFVLQNEDFLSVKLGGFKPQVESVKYYPLSSEEIAKTEIIAKTVCANTCNIKVKPFEFFTLVEKVSTKVKARSGERIVHGYLTPCGDVFMQDDEYYMPDWLLKEYSSKGINGVWVHGLLSALSPYPFDENLSKDYKKRRYKLINLVKRCKKHGVKVYLYLNEPRGIPVEKLGKFSHLAGRVQNGVANLCIENKEVQDYLYFAVKDLFDEVQDLGGTFTITMSENPTHCNYVQGNDCPKCKDIPAYLSAVKVNNIIAKAVKDSRSNAEVIANLWGWSPYMGWTNEQTLKGIDLLDKDISVMCVSEFDLDIEKGSIKSRIIDYSISNPGPGEIAKSALAYAKSKGHKTYAKIQINNSWECSAVPYLPVFDLTYEHIKNLSQIGVENLMLTWTQGGFPSPTMDMIADFIDQKEDFSLDRWYDKFFGEYAVSVKRAVESFCKGFREYPFSIQSLYLSPKTLGLANLWDSKPSEKGSTMVCYAYDDYESWTTPYPYETYISQYEKLLASWQNGVSILKEIPKNRLIDELLAFAEVAYCHFSADKLQTEYSKEKRGVDDEKISKILRSEKALCQNLLPLIRASALVGFETSNHYFYSERNVLEKIINVERLLNANN